MGWRHREVLAMPWRFVYALALAAVVVVGSYRFTHDDLQISVTSGVTPSSAAGPSIPTPSPKPTVPGATVRTASGESTGTSSSGSYVASGYLDSFAARDEDADDPAPVEDEPFSLDNGGNWACRDETRCVGADGGWCDAFADDCIPYEQVDPYACRASFDECADVAVWFSWKGDCGAGFCDEAGLNACYGVSRCPESVLYGDDAFSGGYSQPRKCESIYNCGAPNPFDQIEEEPDTGIETKRLPGSTDRDDEECLSRFGC